jgi:hypothetical protein
MEIMTDEEAQRIIWVVSNPQQITIGVGEK